MVYSTKITDFGYKKRFSVYVIEIGSGGKKAKNKKRKRYANMSEAEKKESDERRVSYYKKVAYNLIEWACMNDFKCMVTLTFKDPVNSYDVALAEWKKFLKRLRHKVNDLKYICVWEYQEARGNVFHFHCLFNFCMEHAELARIWGNGFVWISGLKGESEKLRQIKYMTKYIVKGVAKGKGENCRGKRLFFTSNNLEKPVTETFLEKMDLEKVIFENMEDVISDGSYHVKDHAGVITNRCDYVELRKGIEK